MSRLTRSVTVGLCAATCLLLLAVHQARATEACVAGTTPQQACPLTSSVSGALPGSGVKYYYKLWASKGTEIRLTTNNTQDPSCTTSGGCLLECAYFTSNVAKTSGGGDGCSVPTNGSDRPSTQQVTAPYTGVYYMAINTERFNGTTTVPYSLSVLANPGVRWPPPCVVPQLSHNTFLSVAESRLRDNGCRVGRIRHVGSRNTHGGDVVSLGLREGSIHRRGTSVSITVAAR